MGLALALPSGRLRKVAVFSACFRRCHSGELHILHDHIEGAEIDYPTWFCRDPRCNFSLCDWRMDDQLFSWSNHVHSFAYRGWIDVDHFTGGSDYGSSSVPAPVYTSPA